jgi:hypothetical protein
MSANRQAPPDLEGPAMTNATARISGTISDSDSGTGIPADLLFIETAGGTSHYKPTRADGRYSSDLPFGTYDVVVSSPGYQNANRGPFTLTVAEPELTLDVRLDVNPAEGSISGTITGTDAPAGIPATLLFTDVTTGATRPGRTLETGWFYADLPYGSYDVTVSSTGYLSADRGPFGLTVADPHVDLELALVPSGSIEGTIYVSSPGSFAPLPPTRTVTVGVQAYHGRGEMEAYPAAQFSVDADGRYAIRGLAPGTYQPSYLDNETGAWGFTMLAGSAIITLGIDESVTGVDVTF